MKDDVLAKKILWFLAATGLLLLAVAALGAGAEAEADGSAQAWLALVDRGEYRESWKQASSLFRKSLSEDQWDAAVRAAREPLGKLVSRKLVGADRRTSLPGAPDGDYVVLRYESSFANKKTAVETVTPMREKEGGWRVSGYFVR